MTVFCDIAPCILVEVNWRFALMIRVQTICISEASVYFNETTRRYIPEECHLYSRRRENLTFNFLLSIIYIKNLTVSCTDRPTRMSLLLCNDVFPTALSRCSFLVTQYLPRCTMEYEVIDKPGLKAGPTEYRAGLRDMITVSERSKGAAVWYSPPARVERSLPAAAYWSHWHVPGTGCSPRC
jgi:hypothetical protein